MGVHGLHGALKAATIARSCVAAVEGQRVGVDGLAWLHRGGYTAALPLARAQAGDERLGTGVAAPYADFVVRQAQGLLGAGATEVIVVFDRKGAQAKAGEQARRQDGKDVKRKYAEALADASCGSHLKDEDRRGLRDRAEAAARAGFTVTP